MDAATTSSEAAESERAYWWVTQSNNFEAAISQSTLWSLPGVRRRYPDRELLKVMKPGDVVFHYAFPYVRAVSTVTSPWKSATRPPGYFARQADGDEGWLVAVEVVHDDLSLPWREAAEIVRNGSPGPFTSTGVVQRKYIGGLSVDDGMALLSALDIQLPAPGDSVFGMPAGRWEGDDMETGGWHRIRLEQARLRASLLRGRTTASCDLCGRLLPSELLVAAHILPRHLLSADDRREFASIAMLACVLGCDSLFEWGYVVVGDRGVIQGSRRPETGPLRHQIESLTGQTCSAFSDQTAPMFGAHRERAESGSG